MQEISPERGIYCNRTLNLRSLQAIGYDMDYTLIHYNVEAWEGQAYEHIRQRLLADGWPVAELSFEPDRVLRGLVVDKSLGNLLKVNRYGYVKRAIHGTTKLDYRELRDLYTRTLVDLSEARFHFLNTLFSISEGCIYSQLVDLLDAGALPSHMGYTELWDCVRNALDSAHVEGQLKAEIMARPEQYVELDPDLPQTLLDQKQSGKKLLLITNSEWHYTCFMMAYAFDPFLPDNTTWRELFDMVIVSARKPKFFESDPPIFQVINEKGALMPCVSPDPEHRFYLGGHAGHVEEFLGLSGDQILYVGDHVYSDVNVSKNLLRWRTALILRELEEELLVLVEAKPRQRQLEALMEEKQKLEHKMSVTRLSLQRLMLENPAADDSELKQQFESFQNQWKGIDEQLIPLVIAENQSFNSLWGYLLWDGKDKTHLTHQIEKYADLYTSRVSNFLPYTPFCFFRSPRGSTPHDPH